MNKFQKDHQDILQTRNLSRVQNKLKKYSTGSKKNEKSTFMTINASYLVDDSFDQGLRNNTLLDLDIAQTPQQKKSMFSSFSNVNKEDDPYRSISDDEEAKDTVKNLNVPVKKHKTLVGKK